MRIFHNRYIISFAGLNYILAMSTTTRQIARVTTTRPVKKLQKPRPLKAQNLNKHSAIDTSMGVFEEIMVLAETVANNLANGNIDRSLQSNVISLNNMLKSYGENLEVIYKDQLDRAFVIFRNGCRDEKVDYVSRLHLLELIELRAMQWILTDNSYYKHKCNHQDVDYSVSSTDSSINTNNSLFQINSTLNPVVTQPLMLGPEELVKSSGKFAAPTKIPGKNYCKDEVVIRNSDSGKVMGIKGRRVHMIEELSETVISFQRVSPGARERLVQITGPTESKIIYAKQLMEDTIRRNASPVRTEVHDKERLGSSSSLNSSTSDDSLRYRSIGNTGSKRSTLLHSFSTNDANLGEYKYTVTVGDSNLKITGTNLDLVRIAKLVLDEYFSLNPVEFSNEYDIDEGTILFEPIVNNDSTVPFTSQESEESGETYKDMGVYGLTKVPSFKTVSSSPFGLVPASKDEGKIYSRDNVFDETEINDEVVNQQKKNAQNNFNLLSSNGKKGFSTSMKKYTPEELFRLADSPLSRKLPENWLSIMKEFPAIVKKLPLNEWIDSKAWVKKGPQEETSSNLILDTSEPIVSE